MVEQSPAKPARTAAIIAVCCVVFFMILVVTVVTARRGESRRGPQQDPEAQRMEQRRIDGGWYRQSPFRETVVERRARMAREARISRGQEGGIEREARREREAREGEPAPPMYQMPPPTYPSSMETRRLWLAANRSSSNPTAPADDDAPPAYDSPAVWPTRS